MGDTSLRQITVEKNEYLWRFRDTVEDVEGKLVIYSADHKGGHLEIDFKDYHRHFPQSVVFKWTGERGIMLYHPITVVRIIRHARRELSWNPESHTAPLVITDGYQLLKDLGYEPSPH